MRLKDYARNHRKRKEYVQNLGLLLVGVDVSKSKHNACIGTQAGAIRRKFEFIHCREGFRVFESALRKRMCRHKCEWEKAW